VLETKLPASLEALKTEAAKMFAALDEQRAQCFVQQLANGHDDDALFQIREGVPVTYAERMSELDGFERNLKDGLPPVVIAALAKE
jgi:hypothetical protein